MRIRTLLLAGLLAGVTSVLAAHDLVRTLRAPGPGTWYLKFIRITRTGQPGIDYVSQWATLTFAVAPSPGKAR